MPTAAEGPWLQQAIERGLIAPADVKAAALPSDVTEERFQAELLKVARWAGWKCYHCRDSRRSEVGFPDLILIRGPVLLVAELKVKKNKPTPAQERWLLAFEAIPGVRVRRWRPDDWEAIEAELIAGWPREGGVA